MTMKRYRVSIREVHVSHRLIDANSPQDAIKRVGDEGEEEFCEYSHTLPENTWTVEEAELSEPRKARG